MYEQMNINQIVSKKPPSIHWLFQCLVVLISLVFLIPTATYLQAQEIKRFKVLVSDTRTGHGTAPNIQTALSRYPDPLHIVVEPRNDKQPWEGFLASNRRNLVIVLFAPIRGNVAFSNCENTMFRGYVSPQVEATLDIRNCTDIQIKDSRFSNGGFITGSKNVRLEQLIFDGERSGGLLITNCFDNPLATIRKWRQLWPQLKRKPEGLGQALGTRAVRLECCRFSNLNRFPAILATGSNIRVNACKFRNLGTRAVELQAGSLGDIINNEITNVIGHGIFLDQSEGAICENQITKVRPSAGSNWGFGIEQFSPQTDDAPPYVLICNNQIKDTNLGMQIRGGRGAILGNTFLNCERGALLRNGIAGRFQSLRIEKCSVYGLVVENTEDPLAITVNMKNNLGPGISLVKTRNIELTATIQDQSARCFRDHRGYPVDPSACPKILVGGVYLNNAQAKCNLRIANADEIGSLIITRGSVVTGHGVLRFGKGDGIAISKSKLSGTWEVIGHEGIGCVVDGESQVNIKGSASDSRCAFRDNVGGAFYVTGKSRLAVRNIIATGHLTQGNDLYPVGARVVGKSIFDANTVIFANFTRTGVWASTGSTVTMRGCAQSVTPNSTTYRGNYDGLRVDSGSKITFRQGKGSMVLGGRWARVGKGGSLIMENCIAELSAFYNDCITVESGGAARIEKCKLRSRGDPQTDRLGSCVQILNGGQAVIQNCTLHSTFSSEIIVRSGAKAEITNCAFNSLVRPEQGEVGIMLEPGATFTIARNTGPGADDVYINSEKVNPDGSRPGGN